MHFLAPLLLALPAVHAAVGGRCTSQKLIQPPQIILLFPLFLFPRTVTLISLQALQQAAPTLAPSVYPSAHATAMVALM